MQPLLDPARNALGVLASKWYPAALPHALLDALTAGLDESRLWLLADAGSDAVMAATLRGVYRAAFRLLATPDRYPRYAQQIWNLHYDSGVVTMLATATNTHTTSFKDWRGHHPFICKLNLSSARPIYAAMGCRNVTYVPTGCVSHGDPACGSIVHWT